MRKLLVANWKENPRGEKAALKLFQEVARVKRGKVDVIICPPFIYLEKLAEKMRAKKSLLAKDFALGAQDVFWEERGAYTSEVGPKMIKSLGARYVIIGHSERRKYAKETDAMINKKITLALKDGLHPILCVGEPLTIRKKGTAAAERYVKTQLKKDLAGVRGKSVTVAYEPIWAIGTGKNDSPEDALAMARFIKKIASRFLYGGSVNAKNIADYVQYKEVDGALVGGASLKAKEFTKMIQIINHG